MAPTVFRSFDGLRLSATFVPVAGGPSAVAVLVHGGGVTREEGGFFHRLADGLAAAGVASLRFDLRGHGESEGRQEDLTISAILNDIRAALEHAGELADGAPAALLGASFGGGICGFFAARNPGLIRRLVLINPLINYRKRFVDDKPYWTGGRIGEAAAADLARDGYLPHSPTFKLGRPLLNEVFHLRPDEAIGDITTPTLILHGTGDTFIPVSSSREQIERIRAEKRLIEIEGAQHGIAMPDDPRYQHPRTAEWQASAIRSIADWVVRP
ncbi:alpha/beta hydrolase [Actinoplanes capillaceus]|uniref:Alpha/beta hydrolase n=1 Tax=Actinoplanes campanulatus TaxID=113559 RepID=A0ABQ3WXV0_9ACTN|nr:alpha/beta fold hydrolase [Actinoplanes capillaceus]GID51117.1 alpha/beta hydrolase [Actinoplanes capillaceus]